MSLTFSERAALGLLSLWPAADLVTLQYAEWRFAETLWQPGGSSLAPLVGVQVLVLLVWMALAVFYVTHALRNPRLSVAAQMGWAVALPLLGPVTMPTYWLAHVWTRAADAVPERVSAG